MKTIGIIGSRRRNTSEDYACVLEAFNKIYLPGDRIVSGGCEHGGDVFAEWIAREQGLTITIHHAAWAKHGQREAGHIRNTRIAEDADVLIACVASDRTGGAEDTIFKATKYGKEIILV